MKTCGSCRQAKPVDQFHRNGTKRDGLATKCKPCMSAYGKEWYTANKDTHKAVTAANRKLHYEIVSCWLFWYLQEHPCVDCGEADPVVLQFDHVRGTKHAAVSWLRTQGYSLERVAQEVEKCEVRCANCHMRVTTRRSSNYRKNAFITQLAE